MLILLRSKRRFYKGFFRAAAGGLLSRTLSELSGDRARKRALPPLTFILILRIQGQGR
jgi:hypothetical protein